jgi:hypothetical protein
MSPTKQEEFEPKKEHPTFNTFAYSLDSFLPIVDLRQKNIGYLTRRRAEIGSAWANTR